MFVQLALLGPPPGEVFVEVKAHDFVGREKAIGDALLERVAVDRLAEVVLGGNIDRLLRGCGESDLSRGVEVLQNVSPSGVLGGATPMALIDDHEIEEVRGELLEDVPCLLGS